MAALLDWMKSLRRCGDDCQMCHHLIVEGEGGNDLVKSKRFEKNWNLDLPKD